jgi:AcrR family transcriptional regulator
MIRNTNVKTRRRTYSSELRDEQADATRTRILDALVREMGKGVGGVSMPAVGREAGVSVPTIYRHFGSKQGLIGALAPYVATRAGLMPATIPENVREFGAMTRELFGNLATMDLTLRAAMASELGREARRAGMPARLATIRRTIDGLAPDAAEADRRRLSQLALILMATPTFHAYHDYLDLEPDAAAELVTWAIGTLVAGATPSGSRTGERR